MPKNTSVPSDGTVAARSRAAARFASIRRALVHLFSSSLELAGVVEKIARGEPVTVTGIVGAARSLLAADIAARLQRPVVIALAQETDMVALLRDTLALCPEIPCLLLDPDNLATVKKLKEVNPDASAVVVTSHSSLGKPAPASVPDENLARTLSLNQSQPIEGLVEWLEQAGYEHVDLVTEPGEYATRGGIVDIFPEDSRQPVRTEFLDSLVISLRTFDPLSQRSTGKISKTDIYTRRRPGPSDITAATLLPNRSILISESRLPGLSPAVTLTTDADADFNLGCSKAPGFLGNFKLLRRELESPGHRYFISCSTEERCERLRRLLGPKPDYLITGLSTGFTCSESAAKRHHDYTLLTERELYGAPGRSLVRHRFKGLPIDSLVALRPGDYVVHVDYGIGLFEGTRRISHDQTEKDYLSLRYAGSDRVYVPVENLGLLDRYIGAGKEPVRLDRIGGRSWLLAKAKAARASAEYAEQLLETHARRNLTRGHAFAPDGQWQAELEASFPYQETRDQVETLAAVKQGMESPRPMDRLVCGDVGYGKTEIALRAAFKAAVNLKQVALLAPTTILCFQHYTTFHQRLEPFPLRVEMLSRLISVPRQKQILADIAAGKVDIIIATHLLLNPKVRFRDLGLLILDEEQKFGVRQKEQVKQIKASVDVLTLTATPVPRTLYMTLAGLRDISTIHTPPPGRREVRTEVTPWNDSLITEHVERETNRDGRVFFVHNRVQTILSVAARLKRLFPSLDIAVAHGRMPTHQLEQVYLDFAAGMHQILLSTAIIESGLDIPNVNTIIVDRADRFGLSDLHQLRGRVGRSDRQAYALFLIPARREITPESRKRLSALLAYSQLGSGFKLALRDLEIRGAGDLLGTRQHGHIARVGLNLYTKMLKEATAHIKGETVAPEPELKLSVSAFLPEEYVSDAFERAALYRRLLSLETEAELAEFKAELVDRFGRYRRVVGRMETKRTVPSDGTVAQSEIRTSEGNLRSERGGSSLPDSASSAPSAVENLFKIALVRIRARKLGLLKVTLRADKATIIGPEQTTTFDSNIDQLLSRLSRNPV